MSSSAGFSLSRLGRLPIALLVAWFCWLASPAFGADLVTQQQPTLIRSLTVPGWQPTSSKEIVRQRVAEVEAQSLQALRKGDTAQLNLFDDLTLNITVQEYRQTGPETFHWHATVDGELHSSVLIVSHRGAIRGSVRLTAHREFRIRSSAQGLPLVEQVDESAMLPCGLGPDAQGANIAEHDEVHAHQHPDAPAQHAQDGGLAGEPACGTFVDVMLVYTAEAAAETGGIAQVEAFMLLALDEANLSYDNSGIDPRARAVHLFQTDYVESTSFDTELVRLRVTDDGFMDEVHPLRDQYGADLVALFVSHTFGACGIGYLMSSPSPSFQDLAFSVNSVDSLCPIRVLAHEMGHNMGCHHDHDNAFGPPAYVFSYGHRFVATDGELYRTVMAYDPGNMISYFSNPLVNYLDTPTGVPGEGKDAADNAQTINLTAPIVEGFRASIIPPPLSWSAPMQVIASDGTTGDRFGISVAVNGNVAIVGAAFEENLPINADRGAAYIFRFNSATSLWEQEEKLIASDGLAGDRFGTSVSISSYNDGTQDVDVAVIGAPLRDDNGRGSGAAYVFTSTGSGWTQVQRLNASEAAGGDEFGISVAASRDIVVVGAHKSNDPAADAGSAYVFRRGKADWNEEHLFLPEDGAASDNFGISVSIDPDPASGQAERIIVGARSEDTRGSMAGAAYIFRNDAGTWVQENMLTPPELSGGERFGTSVAISGTTALVGAPFYNTGTLELPVLTGGAFAFRYDSAIVPATWVQDTQVLLGAGAQDDEQFGFAVDLDHPVAIIGGYLHDILPSTLDAGAAYVFRASNSGWNQEAVLTQPPPVIPPPPPPPNPLANDLFGYSVAVSGNIVMVGMLSFNANDPGSVYISSPAGFTDCNENGFNDPCEIAEGTAQDCNLNTIPDSCDIASGLLTDCDGNGIPDTCDVAGGGVPDCNANLIPDSCDIASGFSEDKDQNGIPDECVVPPGCSGDISPPGSPNGVVDIDDLFEVIGQWGAAGGPADITNNGIVDIDDLFELIGQWGDCD